MTKIMPCGCEVEYENKYCKFEEARAAAQGAKMALDQVLVRVVLSDALLVKVRTAIKAIMELK